MKIDGIDKIILKRLTDDARTPIITIAIEVGISGAAIHQRIKKLEKSKLIKGYNLAIDHRILGYNTTAFVGIFLNTTSQYQAINKKLKEIPEIIETHYTTGNYPIFIKILCKNNEDLMHLLTTKIQLINGIDRTETFISLEQSIDRQIKI